MSEEIILEPRNYFQLPIVSVGEYAIEKLQKLENKTCLIEFKTGNELKVKDIISKSQSLAVSLLNRGIEKTDIFMCFSQNSLQYALSLFAFFFLGNTYTPMNPTKGVFELKNQIRNSRTTVIFTSLSNANIVQKVLNEENNEDLKSQIKFIVVFDGSFDNFLSFDDLLKEGKEKKLDKIPFFEVKPNEDICTIAYTSGTTGLPKGAMTSHSAFVANIHSLSVEPMIPGMTIAFERPFGHSSGNQVMPGYILCNYKLILIEAFNEELILKSIEKYKLSFMNIFPSLGQLLLSGKIDDKYDISSVTMMTSGGVIFPIEMSKRLIEKYKIKFSERYGMTEYIRPTAPIFDGNLGDVGVVADSTEIKVIDMNTGKSLGPDIDGEICVRGTKLFEGYLNNENATKAAIDSKGWFHTGDVGHYDTNERLYITDRLKELIKYKKWSVSPAEIESFLLTHESVENVVVIGVKHKTDGQLPRAYIKVKNEYKVTESELIKYVEENMAFQSRLRGGVVFVDEIPLTIIAGKVDRQYFKSIVSNELL